MHLAVMAEFPLEVLNTGVKTSQCRCLNIKVLTNHRAAINSTVKENFNKSSTVFSDKGTSHVGIHITEKSYKKNNS